MQKRNSILLLLMFLPIFPILAGSWSTSGTTDLGCTTVNIPAGARYVRFDLTLDDFDDEDDWDLWVYFPTRTDCSTEDCRPSRGSGFDEHCGPYNPSEYDPTSTCGAASEVWRVRVTEENYTYDGWELDVTWVDCNVGNDCSTPIDIDLPEDLTYLDWNQWTTGRGGDYSSSCLGTYDGGEDIIYRLNVDRAMVIDIELDPHGTAGTGLCIDNACPPDGSCIAQSTNASGTAHSVTDVALSAGTYYIMVDSDPSISASIPDFDLRITSPIDCTNPVSITIPAEMPYTATQQFTCGRVNDVEGSCLDGILFDYDSGEDMLYELTVTEDVYVDITMDAGGLFDGTPGTAILLDSECPPSGSCIDNSANLLFGEHGLYSLELSAGTYFIMIDSDSASARCIPDYTLTIDEASAGATCAKPIVINLPIDLPYTHADATTADMGADYQSTCLGSYDGGEDVVYKLNVAEDVVVDIELEPLSDFPHFFLVDGTGVLIDYECPPASSCIDYSTESGDDMHGIYGVPLLAAVGQYYIMVDCDPIPFFANDFDYELRITEGVNVPTPPNPTATANPCGPQTITRSGTPPADITWYWQGTSCGTRTDLGSGATYIATASGTYYIRARHTSGLWSDDCGSVTVTVNPYPTAPTSAASDRSNFCASDAGNISLSVTGGSGTTARWFTDSCGGTEAGTGNPLVIASPTSTTTYYVRWENSCGNSSCVSTTVNVYNTDPVGTWTGYADTDWSNPLNWGQCTLPTASTDVTIPASPTYSRFPTVDTDDGACLCRNVTIGGTLSGGTGDLHVYGEWLNNGTFNCGTGKVTFIGTGSPAIGGSVDTDFHDIVTKNSTEEIDLRRDATGNELDLREPGNEGLDLRDGDEIDLR